ncbi:MAG: electron transfer flavoprotein subunit alpha/FixB family protein [Acidobacteria bacterium]|nr:electron transfer flavoprotein subunit alpha/FixB family protein [Acidobacteriota bacterium]
MSVLVFLEQSGGKFHRMSWEALAAASELGGTVYGVTIGEAGEAASKPMAALHTIADPLLAGYSADGFTSALEQLIRAKQPRFVVFPHTYQVRDFGPKLATRFGRVFLSDAVKLGPDGVTRQLFQGKLNAGFTFPSEGPIFVSVQAGAYRGDALPAGSPAVEPFAVSIEASVIRAKSEEPFRESARAVDLTAAEIIVSVGRGIKEKENIPMVEELAAALGGELAASRPICDNGWLPMERQVGSSGQTVAPKVYIAIGISGAIQHQVGMKGSKAIVAINKDADAPIFEIADYGIVGDLFEVVPALTEAVKKAKGG